MNGRPPVGLRCDASCNRQHWRKVDKDVMDVLSSLAALPAEYVTKLLSSTSNSVAKETVSIQKSDSPGAKIAKLDSLLKLRP